MPLIFKEAKKLVERLVPHLSCTSMMVIKSKPPKGNLKTSSQRLHTDYSFDDKRVLNHPVNGIDRSMSLSVIFSIMEGTKIILSGGTEQFIPPFHVFLMEADFLHGGGQYLDCEHSRGFLYALNPLARKEGDKIWQHFLYEDDE